jgi:hypothetical protein
MGKIKKLTFQKIAGEGGQSLVLIALVIFALVALLALVLDGGMAYAQRRAAQNAADAGALAGATIYCATGDVDGALAKALEYSVNYNHSNRPRTELDEENYQGTTASLMEGKVTVNAPITYPAFFASIFGYSDMTVSATASAGCFIPCLGNVIPIVLACGPPDAEGYVEGQEEDCFVYENDPEVVEEPRYVIADTTFVDCEYGDDVCEEYSKVFSPGLFSWLDVEGTHGTNAIRRIIRGDTTFTLNLPMWFRGTTGVRDPVYQELADRIDEIFVVPVFDSRCVDGDPRHDRNKEECEDKIKAGDNFLTGDTIDNSSAEYFRVIRLALFQLKCVCRGDNSCVDNGNGCFGREYLVEEAELRSQSLKTIEGVFLKGISSDVFGRCGDGTGAGLYTIYLDN